MPRIHFSSSQNVRFFFWCKVGGSSHFVAHVLRADYFSHVSFVRLTNLRQVRQVAKTLASKGNKHYIGYPIHSFFWYPTISLDFGIGCLGRHYVLMCFPKFPPSESSVLTERREIGTFPSSDLLLVFGLNQFGKVICNSLLLNGLGDIDHVPDMP